MLGAIGVVAFLMMLPRASPLEPASPAAGAVPWRLNLVLALATVAVVALGTQPHRPWQGALVGVFLLTLLSTLAYVRHAPDPGPRTRGHGIRVRQQAQCREYRPRQVPGGMFAPTLLAWKEEFQPPVSAEPPGASWSLTRWQAPRPGAGGQDPGTDPAGPAPATITRLGGLPRRGHLALTVSANRQG